MAWPKGQPRKTQDVPKVTEQIPAADVQVESVKTEQTVKMSEVQGIVDAAVKKAVDGLNQTVAIDDTGYWQATCRCQSEIFGCIDAEQVIWLDEAKEKRLKLGKFEEFKKDAKTGAMIKLGCVHLRKPDNLTMQKIMQMGEGRAVEEGLLIHSPLTVNQSLSDKMPFRLVSAK